MKARRLMSNVGLALAAGAVGATGGLLFAPQSGRRTRRLIGRKAEDIAHGARQMYERIKESGNGAGQMLTNRLRLSLAPRMARGYRAS